MTYLPEAFARYLARLAANRPATISAFPTADEFEAQRAHLETIASLFDDYLHSVAIDAAANSSAIITRDFISPVSTALSDQSLTSQFTDAAERLREDETAPRDDFAEHNTQTPALSGAV